MTGNCNMKAGNLSILLYGLKIQNFRVFSFSYVEQTHLYFLQQICLVTILGFTGLVLLK